MKFDWRLGLIWVDICLKYDQKNYHINHCIIDTGSATTAIDIELVQFNYTLPTEIKRLSGIGGTHEVVSQKVDAIDLNGIELQDLTVEFGDLKNTFGINGFIGTDILSKFRVDIDFSKKEIDFFRPQIGNH